MFLSAQLCTKIKRNRFVLATISVLTILIISLMIMSMQLKNVYDRKIKEEIPFDIMAYTSETLNKDVLYDYLNKHNISYQDHFYQIYQSDMINENLRNALFDTPFDYPGVKTYIIKESDVQALLKLEGYDALQPLNKQQYGLLVTPELKQHMEAFMKQGKVQVNDQKLSCAYIESSRIGQSVYVDYYLILPDAYVQNCTIKENVLVMNVNGTIPDTLYDETKTILDVKEEGFYLYRVKPYYIKDQLSIYTMVIFALLYVSMIAVCILATIIATQQLSDMNEQKETYHMMWKMGCDKQAIKKLLFQQVSFYFFTPLLLPCLYLPFVIYGMNVFFSLLVYSVPTNSAIILAPVIFLLIYGCYFILTYQSCKRSMEG